MARFTMPPSPIRASGHEVFVFVRLGGGQVVHGKACRTWLIGSVVSQTAEVGGGDAERFSVVVRFDVAKVRVADLPDGDMAVDGGGSVVASDAT